MKERFNLILTEKPILIVIVGPTAIGKTALAIQLAQYFSTEIISADSRQFFREMSIGTAKPSEAELTLVPHHFINSHSVSQLFSTGDFEIEALNLLEKLFKKNPVQVMVGGSGLYINAVCTGLDEMPDTDLTIRAQLNQEFKEKGIDFIRKKLQILDSAYFAKVDQSNSQRMIRALEMVLSTGQKLSDLQQAAKKERPFEIIKIGLNTDREILYQRINQRVDLMIENGLVEEVKSFVPYKHLNALKTVGYTEIFDYLDNKTDLPTAIEKIKQNTRRFAKRQLTWFKKDEYIRWFEPLERQKIIDFIVQAISS